MPSFQTMHQSYNTRGHSYVEVTHFNSAYYCAISEAERARLAVATHRGRQDSDNPDHVKNRTPEESQKESLRRTRKSLKQLIMLNCDNSWRFLTLTYAGSGCQTRAQIARDVQHMVERMEARLRRPVRYICVYEYHHTGHGLHAHLLIDAPYETNEEFARLYWHKGFVRMMRLKKQGSDSSLIAVLKYLIKYIAKDDATAEAGEKRYSSSRDLNRTPETTYHKDPQEHVYTYLIAADKDKGYREVDTWRISVGDIEMIRTILVRDTPPSGAGIDASGDEW